MLTVILLAASILLVLALLAGHILGWAEEYFKVKVDPKVEAIQAALPGANCGGCGFVGCADYAEAVGTGKAPPNKCGPGGESCAKKLAAIMGVEMKESWPYRPVVHCSATLEERLGRNPYRGEASCAGANLIAGVQGCVYGCLGLGDCVRVCRYDAMKIVEGLATIDYLKCTGCGACARICPRNIITSVPFKAERMLVVKCANKDFGKDVKAVCTVGCIGCKACERTSPLFKMAGNIPTIDYQAYQPGDESLAAVLKKCPMGSLVYVGKPSPEDLEKVAQEKLPERIEADFKTTVDKTEWRG
jgi:RnfABCDGE-type electron transport complex B subunit